VARGKQCSDAPGHDCKGRVPRLWLWLLPLALLAGAFAARWRWPARWDAGLAPAVSWALLLAAIAVALALMGWRLRGNVRGILVTRRNVASLNVLQLVAWTTLICSAIVAVALWQPHGLSGKPEMVDGVLTRPEDPLADVAWQTAAVAGTGAAATTLLVRKGKQQPDDDLMVDHAKARVAADPQDVARRFLDSVEPPADDDAGAAAAKPLAAVAEPLRVAMVRDKLQRLQPRLGGPQADAAGQGEPAKDAVDLAVWLARHLGREQAEAALRDILRGSRPLAWSGWMVKLASEEPGLARRLGLATRPAQALAAGEGAYDWQLPRLRDDLKRMLQAGALAELQSNSRGLVFAHPCPCQARLSDLLEGDEVLDNEGTSATKVQFLLLTLTALVAYGAVLWHAFAATGFDGMYLPKVPEHLTEIVGASGAGYLIGKAPDRSRR
jgi:hypothetical protein